MDQQLPKGKGLGRMGGKGGIRGKRGITISIHNIGVGAQGRQHSTEKTSSDSIASYYADGW